MSLPRLMAALGTSLVFALACTGGTDGATPPPPPPVPVPVAAPEPPPAPEPVTKAPVPGEAICCHVRTDAGTDVYWPLVDGACEEGAPTSGSMCEEICCAYTEAGDGDEPVVQYSHQMRAVCGGNGGMMEPGDVVTEAKCEEAAKTTTTTTTPKKTSGGSHTLSRPGSGGSTRPAPSGDKKPSSGGMSRPR